MRRKIPIKKVLRVVLIFLVVVLIAFFSLNYTINNNDSYMNELIHDVSNQHPVGEDILSVNVYGGYYIVETNSQVVVLNKEYEEVFKESISKLSENKNHYDLVYRTNKLMYEETIVDDDVLTYNYYDAYSLEKVSSIVLE